MPSFSQMNIRDGRGAFKAESGGQFLVGWAMFSRYRANKANVANIVFRKDRARVQRAYRICETLLGNAVSHVVFMRPKKKVILPDASRSIAGMTNFKAVQDLTMRQFPSDAVCAFIFAEADTDCAVTTFVSGPSPQPALAKFRVKWRHWSVFVHFFPKATFQRAVSWAAGGLKMVRVYTEFVSARYKQAAKWRQWLFSDEEPCGLSAGHPLTIGNDESPVFRRPNQAVTLVWSVGFFVKALRDWFVVRHTRLYSYD